MRTAAGVGLMAVLVLASAGGGQPPAAPKPAALRLPDGSVVVLTKSPTELDPPVEGVLLGPAEYQALVDQADLARKAADQKPVAPSSCVIRGTVTARGVKLVAALSITFEVRTTAPRTPVLLGTKRAFLVGAKRAGGGFPVLSAGDDGLTYLAERPGDHTLTLDLEAPVAPRGTGDFGFDLSLPRAAVTTLALAAPPGVPRLTVTARTPDGARPTTEEATTLARPAGQPGYPVGPADSLDVAWSVPPPAGAAAARGAEVEVAVRVDDTQIETVARVRLRGPAAEWQIALPAGADVVADRAGAPAPPPADPVDSVPPGPAAGSSPGLTRPAGANKTVWTFRPPDPAAEWLLTATVRQPRPPPPDPKHRGPFAVGPVLVLNTARQTGTVKLVAPPTTRLAVVKSAVELRRQDIPPPAAGDADDAAVYRYTAPAGKPAAGPLLELSAKPVPGFVRVQPRHTLRRTDAGWRLLTEVRVVPVRVELDQVVVEFPAGFQAVEAAGPAVDDVLVLGDTPAGRRLAVRLATPQKEAFDLTLTAALPGPPAARSASLSLPRFPGGLEQPAKVQVVVPDGFDVAGTAATTDGRTVPLAPEAGAAPGPVSAVGVQSDKPVTRLDVAWQPYRPDLPAEVRAEVDLTERQAVVTQTVTVRPTAGDARPVRLRGPAVGLRAVPGGAGVELIEPGVWAVRPPPGVPPGPPGAREVRVTVVYALPLPPRPADGSPARAPLPLVWPESATPVEATVRLWGAGLTRRIDRVDGPWRELPPEPAADRDELPWRTLAGSGPTLPLALDLADADAGFPAVTTDRTLIEAWVTPDGGLAVRGRFALRRWSSAGVAVDFPAAAAPDFAVDGRRLDPATLAAAAGPDPDRRAVRLPLSDPKPGRPGVVVDVRYLLPAGRRGVGLMIPPPRLLNAAWRTPARWRVVLPADATPLDLGRQLTVDQTWAWRRFGFAPTAAATPAELDEWLTGTPTTDPDGAAPTATILTAWQAVVGPVRLTVVPRAAWVAGCSLVTLVGGLALARLRPVRRGVALTLLGVGVAAGVTLAPQPAGQVIAGGQPGAAALAVVLTGLAGLRFWHARRLARLPGFTRTPPADPSSNGTAARRTVYPAPPPMPALTDGGRP